MSNKLKAHVDPLAGGEFQWYMAGGGAAWWHIIHHMEFWHGAHDWTYFNSVEKSIFPNDIEGAALQQVTSTFPGKFGAMDVALSRIEPKMFEDIVNQHCVQVDDIYVFKPESIISRYATAGNPEKKEKRDIRVGMLKLVLDQQPITEAGVEKNKPKGAGFLKAIGNVKLKHVNNNNV